MTHSLGWDLRWHTPHGWEKEYVRSQLLPGVPVANEFPPLCVGGLEAQLRSPLSCQPLTAFRRGQVIAIFRSRQGSSVASAEVVHRYAAAGANVPSPTFTLTLALTLTLTRINPHPH